MSNSTTGFDSNGYARIFESIGGGTTTTLGNLGNTFYTLSTPIYGANIATPNVEIKVELNASDKGITPKFYFKIVKGKFKKLEREKLKAQLIKLRSLVKNAKEFNQQALYERFSEMIAVIARELEAEALGLTTYISKQDVDKYRSRVIEIDGSKGNRISVNFEKLEDFKRSIPKLPGDKIKRVKELNLFDTYHILHLDYTKEVVKTNKEKIREKDPIVFGAYLYAPDRLYYICDWVDEFCDLTLDKFVDTLRLEDPEYELETSPDLDKEFLEQIKQEVLDRACRLKGTNPSNYRDNMKVEDELNKKKTLETATPEPKKSWFSRFRRKK
jgi:hypothetical protein